MELDKKVHAKLLKLLALAERGVGGEKQTAQRMLQKMLDRHGLSIDDLGEAQRSVVWFTFSNETERKLGRQISAQVLNTNDVNEYALYSNKNRRRQFGAMLAPAEAVEFELRYEVLRKALSEHMDAAYQAFVQANNIFPDVPASSDRELTDRDRAVMAMAAVTSPTSINPRIGRETQ